MVYAVGRQLKIYLLMLGVNMISPPIWWSVRAIEPQWKIVEEEPEHAC